MNLGGTVRLNRFGVFVVLALVIILFYYMNKSSSYQPRNVNLRHLLYVSIEIAERGGVEIVKAKKENNLQETSKGKTKEGVNIPVTAADLKSHCAMVNPVRDLFPDIKIISEEKDPSTCSQSLRLEIESKGLAKLEDVEVPMQDVVIWIDPLDATHEFTEDLLEYVTTMVCVAYKGIPVIGVIHRPFAKSQKTFWGWKNQGHTDLPLSLHTQDGAGETVIISRSHAGKAESVVKKAFGKDVNIVRAGGSGFKVLQLIAGNATVYTHVTDIQKWDICAGDAILTAAGGRFSTLEDDEIPYNAYSAVTNVHGVLATMPANSEKHNEFAERLYKALKEH